MLLNKKNIGVLLEDFIEHQPFHLNREVSDKYIIDESYKKYYGSVLDIDCSIDIINYFQGAIVYDFIKSKSRKHFFKFEGKLKFKTQIFKFSGYFEDDFVIKNLKLINVMNDNNLLLVSQQKSII